MLSFLNVTIQDLSCYKMITLGEKKYTMFRKYLFLDKRKEAKHKGSRRDLPELEELEVYV